LVLSMLMRTAEPALLVPGLDSGCVPTALGSTLAAVALIFAVCVLEPAFGVARVGLVGERFNSD
jgi:hypothetical protein